MPEKPKSSSFYVWLALTALMCGVVYGALEAYETSVCRLACNKKVCTMKLSSGDFRQLVNNYRKERGLPQLFYDDRLDKEAQQTAEMNAEKGKLIHADLNGYARGEIIAYNYSGFRQAVDQWNASNGHRPLLQNPDYRYAGCACVERNGRFYCCVRFR